MGPCYWCLLHQVTLVQVLCRTTFNKGVLWQTHVRWGCPQKVHQLQPAWIYSMAHRLLCNTTTSSVTTGNSGPDQWAPRPHPPSLPVTTAKIWANGLPGPHSCGSTRDHPTPEVQPSQYNVSPGRPWSRVVSQQIQEPCIGSIVEYSNYWNAKKYKNPKAKGK